MGEIRELPKIAGKICLFFFIFLIYSNSFASAIGLPDSDPLLGFGTKVSRVALKDDIGDTRTINSAQSLSVYFSDWFIKDTRYLSEVYIDNYAFKADESHIGQIVAQPGFRFVMQSNQTITNNISPWFGAGIDFSYAKFTKRHSVDSEGFLLEEFDNKSKTGLGLLVNIMDKWPISHSVDIAAKLEYSFPLTKSVGGISAGVILFFQPDL